MGCGCLLALLAAVSARLVLIILWLFTTLVDRAFDTFIVPLLGLIVFPYATLFYVLAYQPVVGVTDWGWVFVVLGFVLDLGSYGASARARQGG
jgi:uncharacterized membrane protein